MAAAALEQSILESKDKDTLLEMAKALGVKASARLKKGEIIDKILDTTGSGNAAAPSGAPASNTTSDSTSGTPRSNGAGTLTEPPAPTSPSDTGASGSGEQDAGGERPSANGAPATPVTTPAPTITAPVTSSSSPERSPNTPSTSDTTAPASVPVGADGEPLADWEIALLEQGDATAGTEASSTAGAATTGEQSARADDKNNGRNRQGGGEAGQGNTRNRNDRNRNDNNRNDNSGGGAGQNRNNAEGGGGQAAGEQGEGNRRRRRRRKGRGGQDGPQGEDAELLETNDLVSEVVDVVDVDGYLDIRDEGYGFLRVKGYLPSKEDAYIPLRLARQYGLRKGDHLTGKVRPAGRNEKNPGLLEVYTVNGADPELAKRRPNFEDLTALFPDQRLTLEDPSDPTNMTARIIDLVSPIGKGQRGIIVSPPKAGKTTIMKTIAKSIEQNNPEVILIVLLIDERPEEVTDMRRSVKGEVISSTFDRPSDEHTHVAEMTIAKARRLVEEGKDVVIMLDGITRLSRAYNLAAPASGKILSGGIDAGALYPPKRFFGAARNVEEGGSLTILATALVDTNSRMDEAIFEEFKGTGNMELRLDRKVAERRIYPAIDVDASSTRHEELLFDRKQLQQVWKLRRVLSGLAADGSAAAGLELLIDRLKTFRTNDEFLAEIAKQPSM